MIARKHGSEPGATITVRKISFNVGVERIYPLHSPTIEKIELISRGKARRAKIYYIREKVGKKSRLRRQDLSEETIKQVADIYKKDEVKKEKKKDPESKEEKKKAPETDAKTEKTEKKEAALPKAGEPRPEGREAKSGKKPEESKKN